MPQSYHLQQKASPRPARPKRKRKPLLDLNENAERLVGRLDTGIAGTVVKSGHDAVVAELDRLQKGLRSKEVSHERYKQLVKNLDEAFLTPQLRAYLRQRAPGAGTVKYSDSPKQQVIHRLLREAWKLQVEDDIEGDLVVTRELNVSNKDLFFMFNGDGRMLQSWARSCHVSLRVDVEQGVIHVTGPERNFKKLFASVSKAMGSVNDQLISASIYSHFDLDIDGNAVMPVVKCFIERPDASRPDQLLITWLGGKTNALNNAKRYILAACQRRVALASAVPEYQEATIEEVIQRPVGEAELGLLDRGDDWTRGHTRVEGLRLPEYVMTAADTNPVFANTLPRTHFLRRPDLAEWTPFEGESSRSLEDIMKSLEALESNHVEVTLGHALNQVNGTGQTFTADIAGLFGIIRQLQGLGGNAAIGQTVYKLSLTRDEEDASQQAGNDELLLYIPVLQPNLRDEPMYRASMQTVDTFVVLKCPGRPTDLQARAFSVQNIPSHEAIKDFISSSVFPSRQRDGFRIKPVLQLGNDRWNFIKAEVASSLHFSVPTASKFREGPVSESDVQARINLDSKWYAEGNANLLLGESETQPKEPRLHLVWSTIDGGVLTGKRQELKIVLDKRRAGENEPSLVQAVARVVNLLK
ncbi:mitochondrial inner-membrane-bound regulator-domain-containing protein [Protomyces lactucae-debilis]|uniref:Mitochondrial inner-membrane-bound regulator-domain-containing protein n=1 Tax=Protomyces lactucae-debilis TaxID=2754530 RepID=A0A1Y2ESU4_PROLT|nr:mitochondrial inner-membrane-bound regulator-domain-containing protein [Protomyces lactucae-debilis]ORY74354.1 mitochondrial inner-membrane-bound regulator-domain-containing protein [Protomyces lactucae-debilis]